MRYLSVCSGVEAASVAWEHLGWTPVGFSEIEPFPSAVLKHRFPNVPNFGDMTKYKEWPLKAGDIDLLVGGTPCQAFSVAGLRKGLEDPRGNLTLTFLGLVDHLRPEWVVWENVPGVLSDKTGAFHQFLDGLSSLGYLVDFDICDAQFFGVPQRRRRIFVCARDLHASLRRTTPTSASITAKLLLETLHGILEDPASTAFASVRSRLDSAALTSLGAQKRMQLLSNFGDDASVCRMLRENLDVLGQLAKTESARSNSETGGVKEVRAPMQGDLFARLSTAPRSTNIEPSWPKFSDDLYAAMKSCTTSTPTSTTTEQIISFCSHALSIAQRIARLKPSSRLFSEAASSALTFIERSTSYARLAGKDVQHGVEWVQYWRDFPRQAEGLVQPLRDLAEERDTESLLPFAQGVSRHPKTREQARKGSPRGARPGAESGGRVGVDIVGTLCSDTHPGAYSGQDAYTGRIVPQVVPDIADTVTAKFAKGAEVLQQGARNGGNCIAVTQLPIGLDEEQNAVVDGFGTLKARMLGGGFEGTVAVTATGPVTHALTRSQKGATEDGTGRGTPIVPVSMRESGPGYWLEDTVSGTIDASMGKSGHGNRAATIAFHPTQDPISSVEVTHAMGTGSRQGTASVAVATTDVTGTLSSRATAGGGLGTDFEVAGGLQPTNQGKMSCRRLMPVETERLQGFPDNWTLIPWKGKPASECPDGPRYKAMGNSMAVPVMRWIGERLDRVVRGDL